MNTISPKPSGGKRRSRTLSFAHHTALLLAMLTLVHWNAYGKLNIYGTEPKENPTQRSYNDFTKQAWLEKKGRRRTWAAMGPVQVANEEEEVPPTPQVQQPRLGRRRERGAWEILPEANEKEEVPPTPQPQQPIRRRRRTWAATGPVQVAGNSSTPSTISSTVPPVSQVKKPVINNLSYAPYKLTNESLVSRRGRYADLKRYTPFGWIGLPKPSKDERIPHYDPTHETTQQQTPDQLALNYKRSLWGLTPQQRAAEEAMDDAVDKREDWRASMYPYEALNVDKIIRKDFQQIIPVNQQGELNYLGTDYGRPEEFVNPNVSLPLRASQIAMICSKLDNYKRSLADQPDEKAAHNIQLMIWKIENGILPVAQAGGRIREAELKKVIQDPNRSPMDRALASRELKLYNSLTVGIRQAQGPARFGNGWVDAGSDILRSAAIWSTQADPRYEAHYVDMWDPKRGWWNATNEGGIPSALVRLARTRYFGAREGNRTAWDRVGDFFNIAKKKDLEAAKAKMGEEIENIWGYYAPTEDWLSAFRNGSGIFDESGFEEYPGDSKFGKDSDRQMMMRMRDALMGSYTTTGRGLEELNERTLPIQLALVVGGALMLVGGAIKALAHPVAAGKKLGVRILGEIVIGLICYDFAYEVYDRILNGNVNVVFDPESWDKHIQLGKDVYGKPVGWDAGLRFGGEGIDNWDYVDVPGEFDLERLNKRLDSARRAVDETWEGLGKDPPSTFERNSGAIKALDNPVYARYMRGQTNGMEFLKELNKRISDE